MGLGPFILQGVQYGRKQAFAPILQMRELSEGAAATALLSEECWETAGGVATGLLSCRPPLWEVGPGGSNLNRKIWTVPTDTGSGVPHLQKNPLLDKRTEEPIPQGACALWGPGRQATPFSTPAGLLKEL